MRPSGGVTGRAQQRSPPASSIHANRDKPDGWPSPHTRAASSHFPLKRQSNSFREGGVSGECKKPVGFGASRTTESTRNPPTPNKLCEKEVFQERSRVCSDTTNAHNLGCGGESDVWARNAEALDVTDVSASSRPVPSDGDEEHGLASGSQSTSDSDSAYGVAQPGVKYSHALIGTRQTTYRRGTDASDWFP
jgi:hypothetical protein